MDEADMGWSWRIGRVAGIGIYVHFTFLLLLAFIAVQHYAEHGDIGEAIHGVLFMLILFGIVVLHELGHALAARRYGIPTRDITLLPIGGVARLERMPDDPKQELVVAIAGPAVNVALAIGAFAVMRVLGQPVIPADDTLEVGGDLIGKFFWVNVTLIIFNMLPAFPMDGGRVLRSLLAMRMDYVRATQIAAAVGQGMALLFGFMGLFGNPMLLFIALFVWMGAAQEASMAQVRTALDGIPVRAAMITDFQTLTPEEPIGRAIDHIIAGFQQDFPVVDNGRPVGVLTLKDLAKALTQHGRDVPVASVMQQQFATAGPGDMLVTALSRLEGGKVHVVPVVEDGRLLGLLTADNLAEVLMIDQALRQAAHNRPPAAGYPAPASTPWLSTQPIRDIREG
jgi:Zn-dependent protease/CBS domain-containing protein